MILLAIGQIGIQMSLSKMELYLAQFTSSNPEVKHTRRALIARAKQAAAWGVPDNESIGH